MEWSRIRFLLVKARAEGGYAVSVLRSRGVLIYRRALVIASAVVAAIYLLVYKGSETKLSQARLEFSSVKASQEYASRYRDLEQKLQAYASLAPGAKDRGSWFLERVRAAMKEENLFITNLSPVTEQTYPGYTLLSMNISTQVSYQQLASWIARLERASHAFNIASLTLGKRPDKEGMGFNNVTVVVVTAVPNVDAL
ncbi:MAG: hypothetical protein HY551_05975 [Elusimicrobia bacterium]|nr:hypothetical protein [Elusimicrobiota bacterium]